MYKMYDYMCGKLRFLMWEIVVMPGHVTLVVIIVNTILMP